MSDSPQEPHPPEEEFHFDDPPPPYSEKRQLEWFEWGFLVFAFAHYLLKSSRRL